jgi:hypothetical protein
MISLLLIVAIDVLLLTGNSSSGTGFASNFPTESPLLIAVLVFSSVCLLCLGLIIKKIYSICSLHYYLKSAEFELMEKYGRWRNSDGGDTKVQKNLKLFEDLTQPTIKVNDNKLQSAVIGINHQPVDIFGAQAKAVYDTRVAETDKAAARKNAVRLNASILRLVLFGSRYIAQEKVRLLSAKEREQLTASIILLVKSSHLTTTTNLFLVKQMFHYPAAIRFQTAEGEVSGLTALERMATL